MVIQLLVLALCRVPPKHHHTLHAASHTHHHDSSVSELLSTARSLEENSDSIAFIHRKGVCEQYATCKDDFKKQRPEDKLKTLWPLITADKTSADYSVFAALKIIDVWGLSFWVDQIRGRTDVRTTFGVGPNMADLPETCQTGDQLEFTKPFDGTEDTTKTDWPKPRDKPIHTSGVVAGVKFTPVENPQHLYTGIFRDGFDYGLLRLSNAKEPKAKECFTSPGLALKVFRHNEESINLVAMWSLDGQTGWNPFTHEMTTFVAGSDDFGVKALVKAFKDATSCPAHVGLLQFATAKKQAAATGASPAHHVHAPADATSPAHHVHAPAGATAPVPLAVAPAYLVFVAHPGAGLDNPATLYESLATKNEAKKSEADRCSATNCKECRSTNDLLVDLGTELKGKPLFDVYAVDQMTTSGLWQKTGSGPADETFVAAKQAPATAPLPAGVHKLGHISMLPDHTFTRSKFGDENLFFRHLLIDDSLIHNLLTHDLAHRATTATATTTTTSGASLSTATKSWIQQLDYDENHFVNSHATPLCGAGVSHAACRLLARAEAIDKMIVSKQFTYGLVPEFQELLTRKPAEFTGSGLHGWLKPVLEGLKLGMACPSEADKEPRTGPLADAQKKTGTCPYV